MLTTLVIAGAIAARRRWVNGTDPFLDAENGLIVVVGAGIAGLSAAVEILDRGGRVLLVEKRPKIGGNSQKATSGVNAAGTRFQKALNIEDSVAEFVNDIEHSGRGTSLLSLAKVLADRSSSVVEKYSEALGLDFSNVNALGGHSKARTHRFPPRQNDPRPFGAVLVKTLEERLNAHKTPVASPSVLPMTPSRIFSRLQGDPVNEARFQLLLETTLQDFEIGFRNFSVIAESKSCALSDIGDCDSQLSGANSPRTLPPGGGVMRSISTNEGEEIVTVPYVKSITLIDALGQSQQYTNLKALILAGGGFAGDSINSSGIMSQVRPELVGLPTTNELTATGDIQKLALQHNLVTYELDQVQLHPTAFVNIKDVRKPVKFLCPEVLRSLGAVLLDSSGKRFVDELTTRDVVSAAIQEKGGTEREWGLTSGEQDSSSPIREQHLALLVFSEETGQRFGEAALSFYIKFGYIKTVDELSEMTANFSVVDLKHAVDFEPRYIAMVTPAVHYTTGGILVDELSRARLKTTLDRKQQQQPDQPIITEEVSHLAINNLFVVGEAAGGLHGQNRLGGNGMSECMVFGSLAGELSLLASKPYMEFPDRPSEMVQSQIILTGSTFFGILMPHLTVKLKAAVKIDHLFVEASRSNNEPLEFTNVRVTSNPLGYAILEGEGPYDKLSNGDKVIFHVST